MRAFTLFAVLFLAHAALAEPCFHAVDTTPGWKRVELAPSSSLAAPESIDAFRTDEPALVTEVDPPIVNANFSPHPGRTSLFVNLPAGTKEVTLTFAESLRGAKVDASLDDRGQLLALFREKRVGGNRLELMLNGSAAAQLDVEIHQHFRHAPALAHVELVKLAVVPVSEEASGFHESRALVYRQPAGEPVELCEAPGRTLRLRESSLGGEVTTTTLVPESGK